MTPTTELIEAARAVVDRWDSPLWRDLEPTAVVINRLRNALAELSRRESEESKPSRCVCGSEFMRRRSICNRQYSKKPNSIFSEFCGNLLENGTECAHDRACHGGESD